MDRVPKVGPPRVVQGKRDYRAGNLGGLRGGGGAM